MSTRLQDPQKAAQQPFGNLAAAVALVWLTGCANPGQPKAPSLHLPEKATGLHAERVGYEVRVSWNLPQKTTDGALIRTPVTASVCRRIVSATKPAPECLPIGSASMVPGPGTRTDTLPSALATGPAQLLEYHVELANKNGRSAGPSDAIFAAGGAAPPPGGAVTAEARAEGMLIRWPVTQSAATMQVTRTWLNPPPAKPRDTPPPAAPAGAKAPSRRAPVAPAFGTSADRTEVVMVADSPVPSQPQGDMGGLLDRSALDGGRYTYVAQRVETLEVAGHKLELRGVPSPPVTAAWAATFPPPAVTGLVTIPGGGFGAAPSIDLSWDPQDDVLGYNVYRATDAGAPARLNPEPLQAPAFRDQHVAAGHSYRYTVTALGRHQVEGKPSAPATELLHP